jgi:putative drug exporter of the RND superfamily
VTAQLTSNPGGAARAATAAPRGLERIGTATARHPVRVIIAWLVVLIGLLIGQHVAGGTFADNVSLPGTQAQTGADLLAGHDHAASGYSGLVVLHASHGTIPASQAAVTGAVSAIATLPHVVSAANPLAPGSPALSADQQTAWIS